MKTIDWQLIEVFLRVAEEGSFTRAAELLGTSQPTVSRQIRSLEESLGVSLFARHARGFELTDRTDSLVAQFEAIKAGVGIGGAQVALMERADRVQRVLPDFSPQPMPVWLAVHRDLRHSPTVRVVMDGLAEFFAEVGGQ
jgi:DNA-binding transcriptional LysR family regulator